MDPAVATSWSSVLMTGFYSHPSKNSTTSIRKRNVYVCTRPVVFIVVISCVWRRVIGFGCVFI